MRKSAYHLHCAYKAGNKETVALRDEQRKVQGSRARGNRKTKQLACMKKRKSISKTNSMHGIARLTLV